jgi:hypothetical protein
MTEDRVIGVAHPFKTELEEEYIPDVWTPEHVDLRVGEALRRLPHPKSYSVYMTNTVWPPYPYDIEDKRAQREMIEDGDYEPTPPPDRPGAEEIARYERFIGWPMKYLKDNDRVARAVSEWLFCTAFCSDNRKGFAEAHGRHYLSWKQTARRGLKIIADGLNKDGVATL